MKSDTTMKIKLPVRFINGQWELTYGGAIPVAEETAAEMTLEASALTDERFRKAVTQKRRIRILDAGTELLIALKPARELSQAVRDFFSPTPDSIASPRDGRINRDHCFVQVHLSVPTEQQKRRRIDSGGLWLRIDGLTDSGIESSTIELPDIPGLKDVPVISLNHACTLLSEVIETDRLAHTASVYQSVFYLESNGTWYPLADLRNQALAIGEREVIKQLWSRVLEEMQSNPFKDSK